jgi:hypothetical protein
MPEDTQKDRMGPLRQAGLLLWRGGLAFTAGYAFYWGAWRLLQRLDWPVPIVAGISLALAGLGLVMLSLIVERYRAARKEGDLRRD